MATASFLKLGEPPQPCGASSPVSKARHSLFGRRIALRRPRCSCCWSPLASGAKSFASSASTSSAASIASPSESLFPDSERENADKSDEELNSGHEGQDEEKAIHIFSPASSPSPPSSTSPGFCAPATEDVEEDGATEEDEALPAKKRRKTEAEEQAEAEERRRSPRCHVRAGVSGRRRRREQFYLTDEERRAIRRLQREEAAEKKRQAALAAWEAWAEAEAAKRAAFEAAQKVYEETPVSEKESVLNETLNESSLAPVKISTHNKSTQKKGSVKQRPSKRKLKAPKSSGKESITSLRKSIITRKESRTLPAPVMESNAFHISEELSKVSEVTVNVSVTSKALVAAAKAQSENFSTLKASGDPEAGPVKKSSTLKASVGTVKVSVKKSSTLKTSVGLGKALVEKSSLFKALIVPGEVTVEEHSTLKASDGPVKASVKKSSTSKASIATAKVPVKKSSTLKASVGSIKVPVEEQSTLKVAGKHAKAPVKKSFSLKASIVPGEVSVEEQSMLKASDGPGKAPANEKERKYFGQAVRFQKFRKGRRAKPDRPNKVAEPLMLLRPRNHKCGMRSKALLSSKSELEPEAPVVEEEKEEMTDEKDLCYFFRLPRRYTPPPALPAAPVTRPVPASEPLPTPHLPPVPPSKAWLMRAAMRVRLSRQALRHPGLPAPRLARWLHARAVRKFAAAPPPSPRPQLPPPPPPPPPEAPPLDLHALVEGLCGQEANPFLHSWENASWVTRGAFLSDSAAAERRPKARMSVRRRQPTAARQEVLMLW